MILIPIQLGTMSLFLTGAVLLVIGMGFFQLGAEMAMTPLGEGIGIQLSKIRHIPPILLIGFLMGAIITINAECRAKPTALSFLCLWTVLSD